MRISVQLYTLRSLLEKDFWGTLEKLSEAGFRNVELAGFYDNDAEALRVGMGERGLKAHSMHIGLDQVRGNFDQVVQDAHTVGLEHVVVPWLDPSQFAGGWKEIAGLFNEFGARFTEHDLKFGYHNHAFEFEKEGDKTGFEVLWENAGSDVWAEIDLFWVKKGGSDPVDWIHRLAPKFKQAHFKDMDSNGEFTELGQGTMDWDGIIAAGKEVGLEWAIIENDSPKIDPLEAVTISRKFLVSKGLKD